MRAMVTGACGFVGDYLVRHLVENDDEVFAAVYKYQTGKRLYPVPPRPLDVCDPEACLRAISDFRPEVIYHLAGISFVPEAENDFDHALLVNVGAVNNIYRVCHLMKYQTTVVLVSSGEVYGKVSPQELPVTEESPLRPSNNYSLSKAMAELVAQRYDREGTVKTVIMRPFNHVGPGQNERFVTASFSQQLARIAHGRCAPRLQVGNLDAQRDFCDVRDMVRAYRLGAVRGHGMYNLGSGRAVAISEILNMLIDISGLSVVLEQDPSRMRPSEVPSSYGSYEKVKRELGWEPQIPLRQTLSDIYQYWYEKLR